MEAGGVNRATKTTHQRRRHLSVPISQHHRLCDRSADHDDRHTCPGANRYPGRGTDRKLRTEQKSLDRTKSRIEEIKVEISDSLKLREQQKQNTTNKSELAEMLAELEAIEKELAEQKKIQIIIPTVDPKARETATDMQAQQAKLEEQIAQLEQDLKDRKDKSEANVTVLPQGSGLNFKPHFVDVQRTRL